MPYKDAKIYFDGSHYIAIPKEDGKTTRRNTYQTMGNRNKMFDTLYESFSNLPKKERLKKVEENLQSSFDNKDDLTRYIEDNVNRRKTNAIVRKTRLMRKVRLQEWNYFCTFTYDDKLHNEESFRKTLSNCLRHLSSRKGWKYIGVWERSPEKQRLHFHGIFYIPEMIGEIKERRDYDTKNGKMQTTYQNSHFLKHFGRNDFHPISDPSDVTDTVRYLMKYIEKTNERLIYSRGLPTYFISDVMDDDVVCAYGQEDRKLILFDNFDCWDEGEYIGQVSKETISKLRKTNV